MRMCKEEMYAMYLYNINQIEDMNEHGDEVDPTYFCEVWEQTEQLKEDMTEDEIKTLDILYAAGMIDMCQVSEI